ncbi:Hypothetical predicted protein [Octopus vulgaris]|uniref:Secreted protein n=1 Tax=Octopus vulgaris TaxID=6645 RepID=A0AA36BFI0_OCTVU|nr:Hypothetical predicted protein [Octopus vulgaris]
MHLGSMTTTTAKLCFLPSCSVCLFLSFSLSLSPSPLSQNLSVSLSVCVRACMHVRVCPSFLFYFSHLIANMFSECFTVTHHFIQKMLLLLLPQYSYYNYYDHHPLSSCFCCCYLCYS